MAGFEHPILYGLFCAVLLAPLFCLQPRGARLGKVAVLGFVGFMAFASLSSAPLLAVGIQIGLILWAWMTGARWWLLIGLVSAAYVVVDLLSARTPVTILINYITFDPATAWGRIAIWDYGSAEMWRHPVFGIGLNDWLRPDWIVHPSVDNFWLLNGMRHGVVGVVLLMAALAASLWTILRVPGLPEPLHDIRTGHVLGLGALYMALCTVHVWGDTSSHVMLLIGAGFWLASPRPVSPSGGQPAPETAGPTGGQTPYSRFGRVHRRRAAGAPAHDNAPLLP